MEIIMFVLFFVQNLFVTLIMKYAYSSYFKYENGMVMGVHIPKEHNENEEVQHLLSSTRTRMNRFLNTNCFLSGAICFLVFWNMIIFILIFCIWITVYLVFIQYLSFTAHRRLYDLKMKNGWIVESQQRKVYIDTRVSAGIENSAIPAFRHLLPVVAEIGCFLPFLWHQKASYFPILLTFFLCALLVSIILWILHIHINHSERSAYSTDTALNQTIHVTMKRYKGTAFLLGNSLNAAAWICVAVSTLATQTFSSSGIYAYSAIQFFSAVGLLTPLLLGQKRKQELLSSDPAPLIVDDDEYWKTGFYYNPSDHKTFVPDRMQGSNYTLNYAKKGAWIFSGSVAVLTVGCLIWAFAVLIPFLHVTIDMKFDGTTLQITSAGYSSELSVSDIRKIELLDELPHDDFARINGGATDEYLIGRFRGNTYGDCSLYIFQDAAPILLIQTEDETVFINFKDPEETRNWFEELSTGLSSSSRNYFHSLIASESLRSISFLVASHSFGYSFAALNTNRSTNLSPTGSAIRNIDSGSTKCVPCS